MKASSAVVDVYSLLARTRELAESPLRAAQAYENTARAIYEAEQAAIAAVNASEAAYDKVSLVHSDHLSTVLLI